MKASKSTVLWCVLSVMSILLLIIMSNSYNWGFNLTGVNTNTTVYNSVEEFEKSNSEHLHIPEQLKKIEGVQIIKKVGNFYEIGCEKFVMKVGPFVDYNADPLALYEAVEKDYKFFVKNNSIEYLRYRYEYPELTHCTVVNWVEDNMAYGVILDDIMDEQYILNLLSIDSGSLEPYKSGESTEADSTVSVKAETEMFVFDLGYISSDIKVIEVEEQSIIYMNDKMVFVVSKKNDINFETEISMEIGNGYELRVAEANPFDSDTEAYREFENLINRLDNIVNNVVYTDKYKEIQNLD